MTPESLSHEIRSKCVFLKFHLIEITDIDRTAEIAENEGVKSIYVVWMLHMRIIDYYNYIATGIFGLICLICIVLRMKGKRSGKEEMGNTLTWGIFAVIMVIAAAIRLLLLDKVPYGLQQDEASIGYDAYCLATYGIDRNGYHWPVYPITWGCGGGSPLLIYLNVLSISLFGTGIVKLRLIPAVLGTLTVALMFFTLRIIYDGRWYRNEASLLGAGFLAVCPWHVIQSRWSLDCNIMPFNLMLSVFLYVLAARKKSSILYALSAVNFAICMYSYGSATIVIPVFLVVISIYSVRHELLSIKQLITAIISFVIVFSPLFLFYCINYLGFQEIITPNISFNRFTAARTGDAFVAFDAEMPKKIFENFRFMVRTMSVGDDSDVLVHYYPGYAALFEFTWPVTLLGLILCVKDMIVSAKEGAFSYGGGYSQFESLTGFDDDENQKEVYALGHAIFLALTIANMALLLFVYPDTSRMTIMFIPVIYFFIRGGAFITENARYLMVAAAGVLLLGAISFTKDYFTDYNSWATSIFMPGYGEAIERAYEVAGDDRTIRSTYEGLASPFMLALYYNNYDPNKFYTTVEYKDDKAEFRVAKTFGNFVFELPEDITAKEFADDVFVLGSSDIDTFRGRENYLIEDFGGYYVVYREVVK